MKIVPLKNCGVEIADIDISNLSEDQYQEIKKIYHQKLIIVFKQQQVNTIPFAKLSQRMGQGIVNWSQCLWNKHGHLQPGASLDQENWHDVVPDPFTFTGNDSNFFVQRVTGMKINGIDTGIFPEPELDWHNNYNKINTLGRGVALQAVAGVDGSATVFMDMIKAYDALSNELKQRCKNVIGQYQYNIQEWGQNLPDWQEKSACVGTSQQDYYKMPLVNTNEFNGKLGLYFHFNNKCEFLTDPELLPVLKQHCLNPEFIYEHWWKPGDIVISEQMFTLHKRILLDPTSNQHRVLHRYTFSI